MKTKRATITNTNLKISQIGFSGDNLHRTFFQSLLKSNYQATSFEPFTDVNFYNCSPLSGYGVSERIIGNTFRHLKKSSYVLSATVGRLLKPTKAAHYSLPTGMPFKTSVDYSYDGIMRAFEDSLLRMGVAKIDLLVIESLDNLDSIEEYPYHIKQLLQSGLKAVEYLKKQGFISALGLKFSNATTFHTLKHHGKFDCFYIEGEYSLLKQESVFRLIPEIKKNGASIIIVDVYNHNSAYYNLSLKGKYLDKELSTLKEKTNKIKEICFEFNTTIETAGLQFPHINSVISSVLPSASSSVEFENKISLLNEHIPNELWSTLIHQKLIDKNLPTIYYQND